MYLQCVALLVLSLPDIRLPMSPPGPEPAPVEQQPISTLKADEWYVIESDAPLAVLSSPVGLVSVTEDAGPIRIKGKFADGNGRTETRSYAGPHVYSVEAVKSGTVELILIPVGFTDAAQIRRQTLTVSGLGPQPPPDPGPGPDPGPQPGPVKSFRVIFVKESGQTLPLGQSSIPGAKQIRDYLNGKTT